MQQEHLIAHVAFQTNRGGVAGAATVGDAPTITAPPVFAFGTRAYRCLVQNSTQTGSPALAVGAGRYSCLLGAGNDDINPADLSVSWNVTDGVPGSAAAAWCKVTRTG